MRKVADDAPLMERVEYMLQSQINPQLAGHGGRVSLMEITEDVTPFCNLAAAVTVVPWSM